MKLISIILIIVCAGCGSIIHGTTQSIKINSSPAGANVKVNNQVIGVTPVTTLIKRKTKVIEIEITSPEYQSKNIILNRSVDKWFFGNLLLGGIVGMIIDLSNGSAYKITPAEIKIDLQKNGSN